MSLERTTRGQKERTGPTGPQAAAPGEREHERNAGRMASAGAGSAGSPLPPGAPVRGFGWNAPPPFGLGSSPAPAVQRLMSLAAFKTETRVDWTIRRRIKAVDTALTAYHALAMPARRHASVVAKRDLMAALRARCNEYLAVASDSGRAAGVRLLRDEIERERDIVDRLVTSYESRDVVEQFRSLSEAQDLQIKRAVDVFNATSWLSDFSSHLSAEDQQLVLRHEGEELEKMLLAILRDNTHRAPPVLHAIAREVGQVTDRVTQTDVTQANPQTGFVDWRHPDHGYKMRHNLNQPLGSMGRMAALVHEFTHLSVAERFRNSTVFLMFKADASLEQVITLVQRRMQQLDALRQALTRSVALLPSQKAAIIEKLDYARGGQLAGKLADAHDHGAIGEEAYQVIMGLMRAKLLNNTITEFDTVVNQMMIWLYQWQIPTHDRYWLVLKAVAEEALAHRHA